LDLKGHIHVLLRGGEVREGMGAERRGRERKGKGGKGKGEWVRAWKFFCKEILAPDHS